MKKAFIDTNLVVYLYSEDEPEKRNTVIEIINNFSPIISIQVINELSNVFYKKFGLQHAQLLSIIEELEKNLDIVNVNLETVKKAHFLKDKYKYSYYDSLIIATAVENDCEFLFSEDLQHNQNIENSLKIVNPFK